MKMIRLPRTKRGLFAYIFSIAVVTFSVFLTANSSPTKIAKAPNINTNVIAKTSNTSVLGESSEVHTVVRVIDGDTFEIETKEKVRMIGIDAPETVAPRRPVGCFGTEASNYAKKLLLNQEVKLVKDISDKDSFNRLLRYVYLGDSFVNEDLVRGGYALVSTFPPDVKHVNELQAAERDAFSKHTGVWSAKCDHK